MSKKTASKSSARPGGSKPAARAARPAAAKSGKASARTNGSSAPARGVAKPAKAPAPPPAAKKPSARASVPPPLLAAAVSSSSALVPRPQSTPPPALGSGSPSRPPPSPSRPPPPPGPGGEARTGGSSDLADRIVATADASTVASHAEHLMSDKPTTATNAARVLEELLGKKPEMLVPTIDRLVQVIVSGPKRSVQTAAAALPVMARLAPARVARHLPALTERFGEASELGKDGLVSTFAALCTASVAYQKRLEPVLELALSSADPRTLQRWTETVLPSLKGEPHARARAVVEERLHQIPRANAQPIATFLGIKLRPLPSK